MPDLPDLPPTPPAPKKDEPTQEFPGPLLRQALRPHNLRRYGALAAAAQLAQRNKRPPEKKS